MEKTKEKHLIPTVKHSDGQVMVQASFAATAPGYLAVTEVTMNSSVHQRILEGNSVQSYL